MNGYNGKILRVNLSSGAISIEETDESFCRRYFGGRGFISYFLLKEVPKGAEPLGTENKLIFATGPVTGVPVAGSGRNSVGAKSPLTNIYGDGEVGGYWGAEFKHAGYDALIVEGKAEKPVYLWINNDRVEIRDAGHLRGKPTRECQELIHKELGDTAIRVAQIGPAGENMVRFACIINDLGYACGRCGIGAVMGSKNLRAVAVRGHQKVKVADPDGLSNIAKWYRDNFKSIGWPGMLHSHGTAARFIDINRHGGLPTRNFQTGLFEGAEKVSQDAIVTALTGRRGCYACPVQCKLVVSIDTPYSVDPAYGGPEYETEGALSSLCGVDNLEALLKANELCNAYGLDTISTGGTIAFAMECFERGILSEKDTGGLKLGFGNAEAMLEAINLIIRREGLGNLLAEGSARAAESIGKGAQEFAMHVKKQEIPLSEPRWKPGAGLGFVMTPQGADHNDNIHDIWYETAIVNELNDFGVFEPVPLSDLGVNKVRILYYGSIWKQMHNCLVLCWMTSYPVQKIVDMVRAVTGWPTSAFELMKMGERCIQMCRYYDIREGMPKEDDRLPKRFFEPIESGPLEGCKLDRTAFEKAKNIYYDMACWDKTTGLPTTGKLQELGIDWIAET